MKKGRGPLLVIAAVGLVAGVVVWRSRQTGTTSVQTPTSITPALSPAAAGDPGSSDSGISPTGGSAPAPDTTSSTVDTPYASASSTTLSALSPAGWTPSGQLFQNGQGQTVATSPNLNTLQSTQGFLANAGQGWQPGPTPGFGGGTPSSVNPGGAFKP